MHSSELYTYSTSDHSPPVQSIISATSGDYSKQKPASFISIPSKDNDSHTSGLIPPSPNTLSIQSSSTLYDQINYDVFKSKYGSFHNIFIAKTQAAKSLNHQAAHSSAYLLNQALAIISHTNCSNPNVQKLIKDNKNIPHPYVTSSPSQKLLSYPGPIRGLPM